MHIAQVNVSPGEPLHVPISIIEIMLWMTLLMLHRNPSFDGYGVFPEVEKTLFSEILNEFDGDSDNLARVKEMLSEQRKGLWLVAIYSALFREKDSSFNKLFEKLLDKGQIVIFGIKDYVYGKYITSDNPSFININNVTRNNMNGLYFPLSPDYLLAIFRNSDKQFCSIEYREVNQKDLLAFNTIIWNNAISAVISNGN